MIKKSCQVKKNRLQFDELSSGSDNLAYIYSTSTGSKSGATPATTAISDSGSLLLLLPLSHGMF
jgi:hypothetical protein